MRAFHHVFNESSESQLSELFSFKEFEKRLKNRFPPFYSIAYPFRSRRIVIRVDDLFENEKISLSLTSVKETKIAHTIPLFYEYGATNNKLDATSLYF